MRKLGILGAIGIAAFIAGIAVGATGCGLGLKDGTSENTGYCTGPNCGVCTGPGCSCPGGSCASPRPLYRDVVLGTPGLVRYWDCNELSTDTNLHNSAPSTPAHNLVITGGTYFLELPGIWSSPGSYFKSVAATVATGTSSLDLGSMSTSSYEVWFKFSSWVTGSLLFGNPTYVGLYAGAATGTVAAKISGLSATSSLDIDDGDWHHLASIYDGTSLKLYIDGVLRGTTSGSFTAFSSTSVTLGDNAGPQSHYDEAAIYNRALTPAEIQNHFISGRP